MTNAYSVTILTAMKDRDVVLSIRVDASTAKQLKMQATKEDRTCANFVRRILEAVVRTGTYPMQEGK